MNTIKIIPLMEDTLCGDALVAEHGLAFYIETPRHRLLADTGQSEKTWENAKTLGVDLSGVDTVFLSHGHYDHCGGLMSFVQVNPKAEIYLHETAGREYYSFKEGREQYIGIDKDILKLPTLHLISENTVIDEELSILTEVKATRPIPAGNKRIHELIDGQYLQDGFGHEQYLVITSGQGERILISGCAHRGILNILDAFRAMYHKDPDIVVSGFHMLQPEYSDEDLENIRRTAAELLTMDTMFYTGHCTGGTALGILKEIMGEKLGTISELLVLSKYSRIPPSSISGG